MRPVSGSPRCKCCDDCNSRAGPADVILSKEARRAGAILEESGAFYTGPVRSSRSGLIHLTEADLCAAAVRIESIRTYLFVSSGIKPAPKRRGRPQKRVMRDLFANLEGMWLECTDEMPGASTKNRRTQGPFVRFCVAFCRDIANDLAAIDDPRSAKLAVALRDVVANPERVKSWHHNLGILKKIEAIFK